MICLITISQFSYIVVNILITSELLVHMLWMDYENEFVYP